MLSLRRKGENHLISLRRTAVRSVREKASVTVNSLRPGFPQSAMLVSAVFPFLVSAFVVVTCQQPLDDLSEISPYQPPTGNIDRSLLQQCEFFVQTLSDENERLKNEIKVLKLKVEALEEIAEDEDEEEEEDEKDGSDESREPSKSLRNRRAAAGCEGGTLAAWACAPQCVFKLKGLCGLSLKNICHC